MTDWRLVTSALILAPLGLKKTSQFSLRRGCNVSYFNLTCSNGPGSCHVAAILDTELTWSTWKTSKKYRTASFLNPTRNIKVFKPFYGSLSTELCVSLLKDGLESVQNPKPFSEHRLRSTPPCLLLVPSSASKPPKKRRLLEQDFPYKKSSCLLQKDFMKSSMDNRTEKWTRNEGYLCLLLLH